MNGILFDRKPFIVRPWSSSISYEKSSLTRIPVWAKLPQLDVRYWTEDMLRTIVGYLGTMLKVDSATLSKSRMMFARVLVDMNVEDGFPKELFLYNEWDTMLSQKVQYDWMPVWCSKCSQFGHNINACRMEKPRADKPHLEVDADGFRPYRKGFHAKVSNRVEPIEEVEEINSSSDTNGGENDNNADLVDSVLQQVSVAMENGFSVLAEDNSTEVVPNTALGADPIRGNG